MSTREKRMVTTFRIRQMGSEIVFTCDPQNVQAMLATKFKDFELGPGRRHTLLPLLGAGIVSTIFSGWGWIDLPEANSSSSLPLTVSSGRILELCFARNSLASKSVTWIWKRTMFSRP